MVLSIQLQNFTLPFDIIQQTNDVLEMMVLGKTMGIGDYILLF